MVINKNDSKRDIIKSAIKEIYRGPADTKLKISSLIVIRRDNHGDEEIQELCNTYLNKLYDLKYSILGGIR